MNSVILGLGTNQGDRQGHLQQAVNLLKECVAGLRCSRIYESAALLEEGAPAEWNIPFLNMAAAGETELSPRQLLDRIKAIERALGRVSRGHWGPREIDIDILAYNDEKVSGPDLTIPHAELLRRDFALIPFAELAPQWRHPAEGKTARELSGRLVSRLIPVQAVIA